jgi:hypothetical protein
MIMILSDGTEHKYEDVFEHYNKNNEVSLQRDALVGNCMEVLIL